jgi:hypothetical protein
MWLMEFERSDLETYKVIDVFTLTGCSLQAVDHQRQLFDVALQTVHTMTDRV